MEESPEEVLARLERYVESRRHQPREVDPEDCRASPTVVDGVGENPPPAPVDTLIPSWVEPARRWPRFVSEVAPALVAVATCAGLILMSVQLDSLVVIGVGAVLVVAGLIGAVRRVPLARAWTLGLVVAALLIRFS